jgi:hypothetical protein
MLNRLILSIIVLFVGYSQAEEYWERIDRSYVESVLDPNYNVRFVALNYRKEYTEKKYIFSFDAISFRIIKDSSTWRFYFPFIPFFVGFIGMWGWADLRPSLPLMLMNPTLTFPLTSSGSVSMGIGYNTDFTMIPRPQLYFAPKAQIEWLFPSGLGLATTTSYQVFDCFATKQGAKFGLLLFTQSAWK